MINERNKNDRRIFIEETIGTRKYFSYRADLVLYKLILCILVYIVIYIATSNFIFSIFVCLQVFLIFTLINKLSIEHREKQGKEILINKIKKDYFKKKLKDIDIIGFENLVKYFFQKQGYINYKRITKHIYSTEKNLKTFYIKILKCYDGAEVEKIDIRNFISIIEKNNIKNGFLISTNEISDEVTKSIDKINENMQITIIGFDKLYDLTEKFNLLPENKFFYKKINCEKTRNKNVEIIKNNTLNNKKIIIYIFASVFFYITSSITPYNIFPLYISYYFLLLTIISIIHYIYLQLNFNKKNNV